MKNREPQEGLQPDEKDISVENRVTSPEPAYESSHEQQGFKCNAAPPDRLAEHFPPAQTQADPVEAILT
jgi:hypothetical protein